MAIHDQKPDTSIRELNSQALALAEQLGRIAGTLEGTAEAWLNRATIANQLAKVRDGATQLLNSLASGASLGRQASQVQPADGKKSSGAKTSKPVVTHGLRRSAGASVDPARAPGKQHRKPSPTVRGAKHSDSTIPKAKASAAARRRLKSYA